MDNHLIFSLAIIALIIIAFFLDLNSRKVEHKKLPPLDKPKAATTTVKPIVSPSQEKPAPECRSHAILCNMSDSRLPHQRFLQLGVDLD